MAWAWVLAVPLGIAGGVAVVRLWWHVERALFAPASRPAPRAARPRPASPRPERLGPDGHVEFARGLLGVAGWYLEQVEAEAARPGLPPAGVIDARHREGP